MSVDNMKHYDDFSGVFDDTLWKNMAVFYLKELIYSIHASPSMK